MVIFRHRFLRCFLISEARRFCLRLYGAAPLFLLPWPYPSQDCFPKFHTSTFAFRKPVRPLTRI